jgi:predicted amino acid-binding ACT domain protein
MSPSPRKRHPYFFTSFEKVPGTPVGNGLPDILSDIQEVCNATLRSLVNNLSISSGPQVVVNTERLSPDEDGESIFPWKRWRVTSDPMGASSGAQKPIDFFQPQSNAGELLQVYQKFSDIADELSAIPKYLSGNSSGGAGRTASGLAMLMGNASKVLQTVAANIDRDIFQGLLSNLFDMMMLTDTSGMLTGEESIQVKGVNVAIQRETERSRQIEFLQSTANPIDAGIIGTTGRAAILRKVADGIGMDGEAIVPSEDDLKNKEQAAAMQAQMMAQQGAQAQGNQPQSPVNGDMGPRTNSIQGGAG